MEPIIKVDNVSMCFNLSTEKHESLKEYLLAMVQGRLQYDEFYALKDVSLDIMPGDFYGLVGLNGSGKSTLLKTIAGVYKPTKGKVTVNGTIAPLIELGAGFDMDLTARENIYLNGTVLGFSLQGHAGYGEAGQDIVCAAVSAVVTMAEATINDVCGAKAKVRVKDGEDNRITLTLPASCDEEDTVQAVLAGMLVTLCSLRDDYPDNIEVLEV